MLFVFGGLVLIAAACDKDAEIPKDPQQQEDPDEQEEPEVEEPKDSVPDTQNEIDPDLLSEYLVLKDAVKITGELTTTSDGQVKVDVKDTIFLVKGYPVGNRILFRHDTIMNITGFYAKLEGASYYYDVPKDSVEGNYLPDLEDQDGVIWSNSAFTIDLNISESSKKLSKSMMKKIEYPLYINITIQPHDGSGIPLDETTKILAIEDSQACDAANPVNNLFCADIGNKKWVWDFTIREYNGQILNVFAPGLATRINSEVVGCCNNSTGISYTAATSPTCNALIGSTNNSSGNLVKRELPVYDFSVRTFELLNIEHDGTMGIAGEYLKKEYKSTTTDFCTYTVGYTNSEEFYGTLLSGSDIFYDFTPCANRISFSIQNWDGGWRWLPSEAAVTYTCNTMILEWGVEDHFVAVFKYLDNYDGDFLDFSRYYHSMFFD